MIDYTRLIPELPDWNEGRGIEIMGWLGCMGGFDVAIGYTELFWPHFTAYNGCVFRTTELREAAFQPLLNHTGGDTAQAESIINEVKLYDLHTGAVNGESRPEPTIEQLLYLGERLCEMWQAKLRRDFPERQVVARFNQKRIRELSNWPAAERLEDFSVTAFQLPPAT